MDCLNPNRPFAVSGPLSCEVEAPAIGVARPAVEAAWSTGLAAAALFVIALLLVMTGGCANRVSLFPNADPALRKTATEFAADAAKRFPYKADTPRGGAAAGRAAVDYGAETLQGVNTSGEDWTNVEVWVNKRYVVFVPKIEKGADSLKTLNFKMLYDDKGQPFPADNDPVENQVHSVEILRDGKMYDVRFQLAD